MFFAFNLMLTSWTMLNVDQTRSLPDQPPALGSIHWERNFAKSKERSFIENKLILILFTSFSDEEIAEEYGSTVLRNPLLKEAIECIFIPLAINNQALDSDMEAMRFFHEPRENMPVIRIYDPGSKVPSERMSGNFSESGLAMVMLAGLVKKGYPAPPYLRILAGGDSCAPNCFWDKEHAPYNLLPMTCAQLRWVKKAVREGKNPKKYLSPNQLYIIETFQSEPEVIADQEIRKLSKNKSLLELVACLKRRKMS